MLYKLFHSRVVTLSKIKNFKYTSPTKKYTMKLKKGDFIEIEYTGRVKETGQIFDLTDGELAKRNNIYNPNATYGPIIICIGESNLVQGLDEQLEDKELNKKYELEIPAEKAFGKKNPRLLKIVSTTLFKKQKINPIPGLQVNMDGMIGTIRTVGSGRTIVDFNHPLAGHDLIYEIKINKKIEDDKTKLESFLKLNLNLKEENIELKDTTARINLNIPKEIQEKLAEKIKKLVPNIQKVEFITDSKKTSLKNK